MLHLILGGAGCGKSALLLRQTAKAVQEGQTVRTFVPEQFAFTYDKRLYEQLGAVGFNGITTGSFRSLTAELLETIAEEPRDAADEIVKTVVLHALMQRYVKNGTLHYYGKHAAKPGFLTETAAQLTELMQSGTTVPQLADAAAATGGVLAEKLLDLAVIYADYLAALDARGMRDTLRDPITAAAAADGARFFRGQHLFLDEYESFTGDQYLMLELMLRDAAEVWVGLRTDDPDAPAFTRFDAVNQTVQRFKRLAKETGCETDTVFLRKPFRYAAPSLEHLSRYLLAQHPVPYPDEPAVTVCEARDQTLEAEYTAAQIRRLLMNGDAKCSEITVVMHDLAEYGSLLEAAFQRYDIPYFMDLRRSVLHTAVMQLPLCLLSLMQRSDTAQLLLLMKTQLDPLAPWERADLENYAYTWSIEGEQWDHPFHPETDEPRSAEDPSPKYETMRKKLTEPILIMRRAYRALDEKARTGARLCRILYECMERMGVAKRLGTLAQKLKEQGDVQGGRALRRLWNAFSELLDALHTALENVPMTAQQLLDIMTLVLRSDQIPVPPQTLDAVTVQSAAAVRFDKPKIVFVLGVNEGLFPANIENGGFFTEREREQLAQQHVELSRSVRDLCADERLIVYKTLCAPSHKLWLTYPLADESGKIRKPSSLLTELYTLFPKLKPVTAASLGVAFYVSTRAAAYFSFVQDYEVSPKEQQAVRDMLGGIPEEADRLERLRTGADPARLCVTSRARMRRLTGDSIRMSATQIENLVKCPFYGFCANGLKLLPREKKDLNAGIGGDFVHAAMESLFRKHPERDDFLAMTKQQLRQHAEDSAASFMQNALGGKEYKSERFMQQYARMTNRLVRLLVHTQDEMRQSAFVPDKCELVIGKLGEADDGIAPYTLSLGGGMTLCLNGKVDRVDLTEQDGQRYLRVVDYKTGEKRFSLGDIYYGLNLQMLLYLFALEDDAAEYADAKPAGVLYMPAGAPRSQERENMIPKEDYIAQYFRMSGTVLLDRGILSKMEEKIAGVYIPAQLAENAPAEGDLMLTPDSQTFTPEQLARLRKYVEKLIRECVTDYANGLVSPRPMQKSDSRSDFYADACSFCKYSSICGVDVQTDRALVRKPMGEKKAVSAMEAILSGEGEETTNADMDE